MNFESTVVTLRDISEISDTKISVKKFRCFFNIPIYQRLYVWGDVQVRTLLEDLLNAFIEEKRLFYLGGILAVEQNRAVDENETRYFDLIDGQQRFTTLWLLSIVLGEGLSAFTKEEKDKSFKERIRFEIRPEVSKFFHDLLVNKMEANAVPNEAVHIDNALAVMYSFKDSLKKEKVDVKNFTNFVYNKVKFVFTAVPQNTDLNKLFEVINNRGLQLKHHEILKAQLLSKLDTCDRGKYGILWDACSFMEDFVERNLQQATNIRVADLYLDEDGKKNVEKLAIASEILKVITCQTESNECKAISLDEILGGNITIPTESQVQTGNDDFESDAVRSIISFPMLLLHTLRIFLIRNKKRDLPKILEKELLQLFNGCWLKCEVGGEYENVTADDIKSFISLLWEIRYIFDKYIIKWIDSDDDEFHGVRQPRLQKNSESNSKSYLVREAPENFNRGFVLLQSMLYYSQQLTTHYWLTPLLNFMHQAPQDCEDRAENYYRYLRHLDNHLLSSVDEGPLIVRTRRFVENSWHVTNNFDISILNSPLGLGFPHYWFYKTEFVLWYFRVRIIGHEDKRWNSFRFTAKNSVEHISPQNAKFYDKNIVSDAVLNQFGNLALVSRIINSEYSNKPFNEKRKHFENRNDTKVDSLKMDLIYKNETWSDDLANEHQRDMLKWMTDYFSET